MIGEITTEELKDKIAGKPGNFYLIDVLSKESYDIKHLPGARNVPGGFHFLDRFEELIEAPKGAEIIVYCASDTCHASMEAAQILEKVGYSHVFHYGDGLAGWEKAGYDFENSR